MGNLVTVNTLAQANMTTYGTATMGSNWTLLDVSKVAPELPGQMANFDYFAQAWLDKSTGELIMADRG